MRFNTTKNKFFFWKTITAIKSLSTTDQTGYFLCSKMNIFIYKNNLHSINKFTPFNFVILSFVNVFKTIRHFT